MSLLPKTHKDFGSADYWNKFFKKRGGKAFEWYGEYEVLCGLLHKYIKPPDKVLVVGCGNSTLSESLYDVGYKNQVNIDISEVVIRQMNDKNNKTRPDMTFVQMDMLQTSFVDGEFSVVLDKGTLDALLTDESPDVLAKIDKMFAEILRVLRLGGRYICVSLAQDHIIRKVLSFFSNEGCPVRVVRVSDGDDREDSDFFMPVFAYVITKFKKMPGIKPILEVCQFLDKPERVESEEMVLDIVKSMQYYGLVRQQLSNKSQVDEDIAVELYSEASSQPRYTLHVVDMSKKYPKKYAIFIVPEGRETEWFFSTPEGRRQLGKQAGFQRLVVVTLHSAHNYGTMKEVEAELSTKVMELAPPDVGKELVPFLSLGSDINKRQVCYRGSSELTGDFVVEDVEVDGDMFRRLVFLSSRHIVQSQAKLVQEVINTGSSGSGKKKKAKLKTKTVVDLTYLAEAHHAAMVAGLSFMENSQEVIKSGFSGVVIGLGGGALASFLHKYFTKVSLSCVELDPAMVKVASDWFGLVQDARMQIHVQDGLEYIKQLKEKGEMVDVLILDVDNKDSSVGITAPPPAFVHIDLLRDINAVIKPSGVFILNLSSRNESLKQSVISDVKTVFKDIFLQTIPEHINQVLFATPSARENHIDCPENVNIPTVVHSAVTSIQTLLQSGSKTSSVNLVKALEGLSLHR